MTIIHQPSCTLCRSPVGTGGKVVRVRGRVIGHLCERDAQLLVVGAVAARKYGFAFLRGFLRARYPEGFKQAQEIYDAIADARDARAA